MDLDQFLKEAKERLDAKFGDSSAEAIMITGSDVGSTYQRPGLEVVKAILVGELAQLMMEVRNAVVPDIEPHICRFNDGDCRCDCYQECRQEVIDRLNKFIN